MASGPARRVRSSGADGGAASGGQRLSAGREDRHREPHRAPVSRGAVYVTLDRLEAKRLLTSRLEDAGAAPAGRQRRYYRASPRGRQALRRALSAVERMRVGIEPLLESHDDGPAPGRWRRCCGASCRRATGSRCWPSSTTTTAMTRGTRRGWAAARWLCRESASLVWAFGGHAVAAALRRVRSGPATCDWSSARLRRAPLATAGAAATLAAGFLALSSPPDCRTPCCSAPSRPFTATRCVGWRPSTRGPRRLPSVVRRTRAVREHLSGPPSLRP